MAENESAPTSLSLLQRVRGDDQQAWRQLVHLYGPLVHRWCQRAGLGDDDTADVFQETFRAVAGNLANYTPRHSVGSFRCWLRTIVRTKVADHFRRLGQQPAAAGGTEAMIRIQDLSDPLAEDTDEEKADDNALLVRRALDSIENEFSERNWKAFQQVVVEGRSAVDVADELDVNPQTVRQANYRIRRRLRAVLKDLVNLSPEGSASATT